jgi:hypothetical protein
MGKGSEEKGEEFRDCTHNFEILIIEKLREILLRKERERELIRHGEWKCGGRITEQE